MTCRRSRQAAKLAGPKDPLNGLDTAWVNSGVTMTVLAVIQLLVPTEVPMLGRGRQVQPCVSLDGAKPDLAKLLCCHARFGGRTALRLHRGKMRVPGMTITSRVISAR